ncbi:MAG: VOC family protein, partial [Methyloceanibacter sp.]
MSRSVDMKLEIVVIPVSDVDRAKRFYQGMGWREDVDIAGPQGYRAVHLTPPGSNASILIGNKGVTSVEPGSIAGLVLAVDDIDAARAQLISHGVDVSEVFHDAGGSPSAAASSPSPRRARRGTTPSGVPTPLMRRSATRTETVGYCRRSPPGSQVGLTRTLRHSHPRRGWRA